MNAREGGGSLLPLTHPGLSLQVLGCVFIDQSPRAGGGFPGLLPPLHSAALGATGCRDETSRRL